MADEPDTTLPEGFDAYALLSKPTLDLTDAEVGYVITDLRRRRALYLKTGKPDKPKAEKKAAVKLDADEKARNTAALLAQLKI
jgi:hypothetical protein